jgi:hypothetical protein
MSGSYARVEVKEAGAGWFGAGEQARMPVRGDSAGYAAAALSDHTPRAPRNWIRIARRAILDLALVMAAMIAVPVALVTYSSGEVWRSGIELGSLRDRVRRTDPMRQFTVRADASITSVEAGRSLFALQDPRPNQAFPAQDISHSDKPWRSMKMSSGMFADARSVSYSGPDGFRIFSRALSHGLSSAELAYLRELSTAAAWRDFDRVARAPAMDAVGGRFRTPFPPDLGYEWMPVTSFGGTKEMAYAAVSRAAYHLAIGQRDSAETILRSVVSFGFSIGDNGATKFDQLIGRVIVDIGKTALGDFYTATRDPLASEIRRLSTRQIAAPIPEVGGVRNRLSVSQMRQVLLARAEDPNELRGVRWESLDLLSASSCTNARELLFGPQADVRDAFARARTDLARYPSEMALLDLMQRAPTARSVSALGVAHSPLSDFLSGTSVIAGAVLGNPRMAACSMLLRVQ